MKSAMHSNSKPASDSDFKPAVYSDLMSAPSVIDWVWLNDYLVSVWGQVQGFAAAGFCFLRRLSPVNSMR